MPLPKPKKNESKQDFMARFMADEKTRDEYPDDKQRSAVANQQWQERDKGKSVNWTLDHILKSIAERQLADSRWGIGTASQYLGSLDAYLANGVSPSKAFGTATAEAWQKELADAASRLTYCDSGMADAEYMQKSIRDGSDITQGAILEYDAVLSTTRKDRDGDILESAGLEIDTKMPLLWQHIQVSPIGKHVSVLKQTEDMVICRFAIADTELGRDAATLTRFGALRKSHGFKPTEFEPVEIVKSADGKDMVKGWHVKRAAVLEGSQVSIPSNSDGNILQVHEKEFDGICTAFSRGQLENELVKSWAKSIYDQRPATARGTEFSTKEAVDATKKHLLHAASREIAGEFSSKEHGSKENGDAPGEMAGGKKKKCPMCGSRMKSGKCESCGHMMGMSEGGSSHEDDGKSAGGNLNTKMVAAAMDTPYLPGSWESIEYHLRSTADSYLASKGKLESEHDAHAMILGTFADYAVVCCYEYGKRDSKDCYRINWMTNEDGRPMWEGEPVEVKVEVGVMEKAIAELERKSDENTNTGGGGQSLETLAKELVAKSFVDEGEAGVRALELVADAAVVIKRQREVEELHALLSPHSGD